MTIDEVLDKNKNKLKEFFENEEIQTLLTSNNFEKLYKKWNNIHIHTVLTALLLKSNIPFLNYMEQIPSYCFFGIDISNIVIPNNVTSIGDGAFQECGELKSITIPNSVTSISDYAFESCRGLTNIEIPNSVTSIGSIVFMDCNKLTKINYLGTKNQWEEIHKLNGWDTDSSIKTIQCTDGDINL